MVAAAASLVGIGIGVGVGAEVRWLGGTGDLVVVVVGRGRWVRAKGDEVGVGWEAAVLLLLRKEVIRAGVCNG